MFSGLVCICYKSAYAHSLIRFSCETFVLIFRVLGKGAVTIFVVDTHLCIIIHQQMIHMYIMNAEMKPIAFALMKHLSHILSRIFGIFIHPVWFKWFLQDKMEAERKAFETLYIWLLHIVGSKIFFTS